MLFLSLFIPSAAFADCGWNYEKGNWSYMSCDREAKYGWMKENDSWYYLGDSNDGIMKTGWAKIKNNWYYFNKSGIMQTGWIKDCGKWYFLDDSGEMITGWKKIKNSWYYFNNSGAMQTGWIKLNNSWYFLYDDGHMAANENIDCYYLGNNGSMEPWNVNTVNNLYYAGRIYSNGWSYTWYSSNILYHYNTPQWYLCKDGVYRDKDGYIVIASTSDSYGSIVSTPWGKGKIYDTGCAFGVRDIYCAW